MPQLRALTPQLKIQNDTMKTQHSEINNNDNKIKYKPYV